MTAPGALTAFIRARLADEEHDAQAAQDGPWTLEKGVIWAADGSAVTAPFWHDGGLGQIAEEDPDLPHIARQDPPATLARAAALRALLGYLDAQEKVADSSGRLWRHNVIDETRSHVAAIWRDHPDYRQEWAS